MEAKKMWLNDISTLEGENLNTKVLQYVGFLSTFVLFVRIHYSYDGSNFLFESEGGQTLSSFCKGKDNIRPFKLSIRKIGIPFSYYGLKQKIWIAAVGGKVWVYDINLDSYSEIESLRSEGIYNSFFISDGNIYMIERATDYKIYVMDDKLLEWELLFTSYDNLSYEKCTQLYASPLYAYYKKMIYFFRKHILYEFNLKNNESRAIGYLRDDDSLIKF